MVTRATWITEKSQWHLQDYFELHANAEVALYERNAAGHLAEVEQRFRAFMKSLLPRLQITRCEALFLLGRLGLTPDSRRAGGSYKVSPTSTA